MESIATTENTQQTYSTGIKTLDRLNELPIVNSSIGTLADYYASLKSYSLLRAPCNLAEMSVKTMSNVAMPIASICNKPIESVDNFLSNKIETLETSYPIIKKPTSEMAADLSGLKEKTISNVKSYGENKVNAVKNVGIESVARTISYSVHLADSCLENKYAKMITTPLLDLTETTLNRWTVQTAKKDDQTAAPETNTIKRVQLLSANVYETALIQFSKLQSDLSESIKKLETLKQVNAMIYEKAQTAMSIDKKTLFSQSAKIIESTYMKTIVDDVVAKLHSYSTFFKNNLPVINLQATIQSVIENLNKNEAIHNYLATSISNLKHLQHTVIAYSAQLYQKLNSSVFNKM